MLKTFLFILIVKIVQINCHGRLLVPPARSSAWREDPNRFPVNFEDNAMFCGGFDTLWRLNGGKCGICGENNAEPKQYEKGGSLYKGFIVRKYNEGDLINAIVEVTANHYGYFEFRICNTDRLSGEATQECLNENLLRDLNGRSQIIIPRGTLGKLTTTLILPTGFSCNHCVFQWKYVGGNSWGTDPISGQSCVGCGPQEQFYGCSDISITKSNKREYKDYQPSYPNPIGSPDFASTYQINREKNMGKKTESSTNLLKRLLNALKRAKLVDIDLEGSQTDDQNIMLDERNDDTSNDEEIERDTSVYNGEPAAEQEFNHKDKTLH